jgi:hypothetical protein
MKNRLFVGCLTYSLALSTLLFAGVNIDNYGPQNVSSLPNLSESRPIIVNPKNKKTKMDKKADELYSTYQGTGNPFRSSKAKGLDNSNEITN